jgi:hypothetical protein
MGRGEETTTEGAPVSRTRAQFGMSGGKVVSREDLIVRAAVGLKDRMTDHDAEEVAFDIVNAYEDAKQRGVTVFELDDVVEQVALRELTQLTDSDAIDAAWAVINTYRESIDPPEFVS